MSEEIIFENLELHPEFRDELRNRFWDEWEDSLKKEFNITDFSEYHLDKNIVYFIGYKYKTETKTKTKQLVSSIAITPNDLGEMTDLTPWLSYVYVLPEYRNNGIAKKMIKWYLENVKIRPLYLWCKHPLENFYNQFGFDAIENRIDIAIMEKK